MGSRVARGRITVIGVPNRRKYSAMFIVYTQHRFQVWPRAAIWNPMLQCLYDGLHSIAWVRVICALATVAVAAIMSRS